MGKSILFDFELHPPGDTADLIGPAADLDSLFAAHEFVPARLPADEESLHKAEAEGKFSLLPADWQQQMKASLENLGACARQPVGYTLALLNEVSLKTRIDKCLGECIDHNISGQRLIKGLETENQPAQLVVANIFCTAIGGMAGAAFHLADKVRELAAAHGLRAKVVLHLLLSGDLPINGAQKANEAAFLKCLQAYATGESIDVVTGRVKENPFDQVFLQSNRNCHGRLSSLERLNCHEGIRQKVLSSGPLSIQIHQRMVDVQGLESDSNGQPLPGSTMSVSRLSWDRDRLLDYCSARAAAMLASTLRRRQQAPEAKKEALGLAHTAGLVESPEDTRLTSQVMNPAEFEGESVLHRLNSSLADRTRGATGLARANAWEEQVQAVSTTELEGVYRPAMARQAAKMLQERVQRLDRYVRQRLTGQAGSGQEEQGPLDVLPVLSFCRNIVQASHQAIMDKVSQIQQLVQPHQDVVNAALEQLEQVRQHSRLWRLLHPFLAGSIADCLESSGRVYLEGQVQLLSCRITVEDLLEKLLDLIDSKIAEMRMVDQNLQQVFACCKQKSQALARESPILNSPLGIQLATKAYLKDFFTRRVAEDGSNEDFVLNLIARLISQHGSISALLGKSPDQIEELLAAVYKSAFQSQVDATDVVDQFIRRYPAERKQIDFFRQLVLSSEGQVLTAGEVGREIVWLKFITVPHSAYQQWAKDLIEKADPKPGTVKVVVDSNSEAISVVQLRTGISLSPLIARYDLAGDGWKETASRAVDRVAATLVPPNPNDLQLRRVLVKVLVTGQLIYDEAGGFRLRFAGSEDVPLGQDTVTAMNKLRSWWPWMVRIEFTFGHLIVVDDAAVAGKVRQLEAQVKSSQVSSNPLLALIDQRAITEVQDQLDFLRPWAVRLRMKLDKVKRWEMTNPKRVKLPDGKVLPCRPDPMERYLTQVSDQRLAESFVSLPPEGPQQHRQRSDSVDPGEQVLDTTRLEGCEVVIIGAGTVGSNTAYLLAAAASLVIHLIDFDNITFQNTRGGRTIYTPGQVRQKKVFAAKERIKRDFPACTVHPYQCNVMDLQESELRRLAKKAAIVINAIDDAAGMLYVNNVLYWLVELLFPALHSGAHTGQIILTFPYASACLRCCLGINSAAQIRTLHGEPALASDIRTVANYCVTIAMEIMFSKVTASPTQQWDITKNIFYFANRREPLSPDGPGVHLQRAEKRQGCPICSASPNNLLLRS